MSPLHQFLNRIGQPCHYNLSSRSHPLNTFLGEGWQGFVKRDDELGFGISGSKLRKYASLIPWLKQEKIERAILIGSAFSNHILSLSQLLIEEQISSSLILLESQQKALTGNHLLIRLFHEGEDIHYLSRDRWQSKGQYAEELANAFQLKGEKVFIVPEGGACQEAILGSATLAEDILQNERQQGLSFDHIFVEAGTGFMASTLIATLPSEKQIHVLCLGDKEQAFLERLEKTQTDLQGLLPSVSPPFQRNFHLYRPQTGKSFGSIPSSIWSKIRQFARQEGFLLDPIYSAKLFFEGQRLIEEKKLKGNILFIHSGGTLNLFGFQPNLQSLIL
ncbi:MAG: putative 1-aminocyclopropane-carboxylate deaminase [Chlamydiales bacterium]|jgi:1-aminocyclopropane-1-carboxylate deaminase/D-cysteine desulfhydrase-like pyridoxal-dependent ACC family enzyme|nr:putative 1-aminocyclopropane-carboxylate deaminase [Chlamydiales bacterium]